MAESDSDSSVDGGEGADNKRLELEDEEDRLTALPDSLIHHILSFLPSTKETIRTCILSKRWRLHWTRVPVLIFHLSVESRRESFHKVFSRFMDRLLLLYDCSKLEKFDLHVDSVSGQYDRAIRFAVDRNVEELDLCLRGTGGSAYELPMFLFEHSSLVRLQAWHCLFVCDRKVNFESLTVLQIEWSVFGDGVIENVLRGSPALELFQLSDCRGFKQLVIASKSLKRLYLGKMFDLSRIEIECPELEELVLHTIDAGTFRFNLPSLVCGTLCLPPLLSESYKDSAKRIIKQFPNVCSLRLVGEFVKIALQVGGLSVPLNCKSLTLDCYNLDMQLQEIKYALCNSPLLEKLVMDLQLAAVFADLQDYGETFWHPNGTGYPCLASHLKTVEIVGLSNRSKESKVILPFVEFLLKNARALEKMVVIIEDEGTDFLAEVSQKLLKLPRCSPLCIVDCYRCQLVIASKSLKKLILGRIYDISDLDISCPCLKGSNTVCTFYEGAIAFTRAAMKNLRQLQHVKFLDICYWLMQILEAEGSSSLLLNCKSLTLNGHDFCQNLPRIVCAIRCSPQLEKRLDIKFPLYRNTGASSGLNDCKKNGCRSDGLVFDWSVSNLRTVEIVQ